MLDEALNRFSAFLRDKSLKSTREREALVKWIFERESSRHFTAEEISNELKKKKIRVSRATVYRSLDLLEESGLLSTMILEDKTKYYEVVSGEHEEHEHLICIKCGKISEFSDEGVHNALHETGEKHGFKVVRHRTKIYGICKDCLNKKN